MFLAAFTSLSWVFPQKRQVHSLTESSFFPPIWPQLEQRCEVGSQREITLKSRPYISDLASNIVLKLRQPKSEIARDNLRFLSIPDVFKSSSTIVWFSRMSRVDSLCKKSVRISLISLGFNSPLQAAKKLKLHWKPSVYEQNIFHTPPACGGEILIRIAMYPNCGVQPHSLHPSF
jgi:hypothetical protein